MEKTDISIVIPAKDEEKRLPAFLEQVVAYCLNDPLSYEIIVVDDGSMDKTSEVAREFQKQFPQFSILSLKPNQGKGFAVKEGFLIAKGDIVLFLDADGSTAPEEIRKNLHYFDEGFDIVVGSRVLKEKGTSVQARVHRKTVGGFFNILRRIILMGEIRDTQCGFKMFKKETIEPLFSQMKITGFGFDMEILYLAMQKGYKIKETPVNWKHVTGSKVGIFKDSPQMLMNMFQIRR